MKKLFIVILILVIIILPPTIYFYWGSVPQAEDITWGVTFSKFKAEDFDLEWKEVYLAILDDLKVKNIRLAAYWSMIEKVPGEYSFQDLDWQINEASKRDVKILLVIGRRLPGWPECHIPDWAKDLPEKKQQEKVLRLIEKVVNRYKGNINIWAWQIENEPFFKHFGICPKPDEEFLDTEISLVRFLDNRPVILTDSGEWGSWIKLGKKADILGISMYRAIWRRFFGYVFYPLKPIFYHRKANLVKLFTGEKQIIVTELQAEPWGPEATKELALTEQFKTLSPEGFKENIEYARSSGYSQFYLWSPEWWYWLKVEYEKDKIWEEAKNLFSS